MPTLIRLFVFLLVLAGLVFGGMVSLIMFVNPGQREVTIHIPTRDLVAPVDSNDPLGINALPDPVGIVSRESSDEPIVAASSEPPAEDDSTITTVEPPPE